MRKEYEDKDLDVVKLIKSQNFSLNELLKKIEIKLDKKRTLSMTYRVQMSFELVELDNTRASNVLSLAELRVFDANTNFELISFATRRKLKRLNKNKAYQKDTGKVYGYIDKIYGFNPKDISRSLDENSMRELESDDDLVMVNLCSGSKEKKFWEIIGALRVLVNSEDKHG